MPPSMDTLPTSALDVLDWSWEDYAPYAQALIDAPLNEATLEDFMRDWTRFANLTSEAYSRIYVATTLNTQDETAQARYLNFVQHVVPEWSKAENTLQKKFVASGLTLANYDVPLRMMRAQIELFREENLPLFTQLQTLEHEYNQIIGAQTVEWEGETKTLKQMDTVLMSADRATRERAFRVIMARRLEDRDKLNAMWQQMYDLRVKIAQNANHDNYLSYRWQEMGRFDYTPQDVQRFHAAIREVVVPAVERLNARRAQAMGLSQLKQWDVYPDAHGREPLRPFSSGEELANGTQSIFNQLDVQLGQYFQIMAEEGLLDLENRPNKAPGGYCTTYPNVKRPFIFMNGVGIHDDLQTMLHEAGHAFHAFESLVHPYVGQVHAPIEFCEVASMAMELLTQPYLVKEKGGFYSATEAARASTEHLENMLIFWAYMAVVDSFQTWVYTSGEGGDPAKCDAKWTELWHTYKRGVDYSDIPEWVATGWHRKLHIFLIPFYYVEYGIAQLGAAQVWANALKDHAGALAAYRHGLSLGNTRPLSALFEAAGAKLAFDVETLGAIVALIEQELADLA